MLAAALAVPAPARAESPGRVVLDGGERAAELVGAPVFASDGAEVGEVADIYFDEQNEPRRLRVKAALHLGIGTRIIEVPTGAFILLRGAAVLEVPAAAMDALPELSERAGEDK
jgi:hypothetical protein